MQKVRLPVLGGSSDKQATSGSPGRVKPNNEKIAADEDEDFDASRYTDDTDDDYDDDVWTSDSNAGHRRSKRRKLDK